MSWANYADVIDQLTRAGLDLSADSRRRPLAFDGDIQRWRVHGEDNEFRGWTRLREWRSPRSGLVWIVGAYGVWHGTDDGYTKIELSRGGKDAVKPDRDEQEALRAAMRESAQQLSERRKAEAKRVARWAGQVWAHSPPATEHEYLARKVIAAHGVRVLAQVEGMALDGIDDANFQRLKQAVGALVVPMHDAHGNVCGIQFIYPRGHERAKRLGRDKEFWPFGMQMGSSFGLVGPFVRDGVILMAEGFATAATLHEATGLTACYAFSANNLAKAAKQLRKYSHARLLFCADDDYLTDGNPGCTAAAKACAEFDGADWFSPSFLDEEGNDRRQGKKLTDFNDLAMLAGKVAVAAQVHAKLDALGWRSASSLRVGGVGGADPQPGDGDDREEGGRGAEAVSVLSLDEAVERFIFIDDKTGEYVFDTLTREICKRSKVIKMLAAGVREDDLKRHPVWQRRAVFLDRIGFDPTEKDASVECNLWRGWPTKPKRGKCDLLLSLLHYQCSAEPAVANELFDWVIKWLAYPIQHPGTKMQTAIIMHGPQGTGKGRFFEWGYMPIFGRYGVYLDQDALEDKHGSDWQSCKLFVLADEVLARAEMYHHKNKLKNLVTSKRIRVNPKGLIAYEETNHLNIVFLSNEKQPLVLENDDRRYCVIWTPPPLDQDFYDELSDEIEAGGVEALHWYLLNEVDLGDFRPWTKPPVTQAKRDLINMSRDSVDRFFRDWQTGDTPFPLCPAGSSDVYRAYLLWCRENGERLPRPENHFAGHVAKLDGWFKGHKDVMIEDEFGIRRPKRTRVIVPSDAALNEWAKLGNKDYRRSDSESMSEWVTACFFEFRESLKRASS